jgi:hypothetical protein
MANERNKNRGQDLRSYLRSQGVAAPPSRHDDDRARASTTAREGRYGKQRPPIRHDLVMRRRRWIGVILVGQAMLLVGLTLYIRGPVNRMAGSVAEYAGAGTAEMVSTSFINYGYAIELPPFSLDQPFEARYQLGQLPWTDKAAYVCLEMDRAVERTVLVRRRVYRDPGARGWGAGGGGGGPARAVDAGHAAARWCFTPNAFELDAGS